MFNLEENDMYSILRNFIEENDEIGTVPKIIVLEIKKGDNSIMPFLHFLLFMDLIGENSHSIIKDSDYNVMYLVLKNGVHFLRVFLLSEFRIVKDFTFIDIGVFNKFYNENIKININNIINVIYIL